MMRKVVDVNINADYHNLPLDGREKLAVKRKALAEEVLQHLADAGLTVKTAIDVLERANAVLQESINSCSVTLVRKHRPCQRDSRTPQDTP